MKRLSKILSVLTSVLVALFLLSGGIALPILWRGFYYRQIDALSLVARTGFSPEIIRGAFDEVMDYLVLGAPFGTGALKWSSDGMSHFADCKVLFRLDFLILAVSAALLLIIGVLAFFRVLPLHRFRDRGPCFWAFMGLMAFLLIFGFWALTDFDSLFTVFHTVFFPGKTNWIFDWRTDEIILILPEDFWARAAGLIGLVVFGGAILLALLEELIHRLRGPKSVYEELQSWPEYP